MGQMEGRKEGRKEEGRKERRGKEGKKREGGKEAMEGVAMGMEEGFMNA
jgi:hypothetical protein